ncbi:MAG: hypothetical protein HKN21_08475 [Candidatus Eisenbacteria bacterium]|uniref:Uncharacterized protein n=1 Tax=Eiseniibacteriota bacterium TaxID=2212470 RepID=A0A7Y2E9J2_UNCEI|nr:hypothetical protein [Candidatus Eisenbacteria bacterium]
MQRKNNNGGLVFLLALALGVAGFVTWDQTNQNPADLADDTPVALERASMSDGVLAVPAGTTSEATPEGTPEDKIDPNDPKTHLPKGEIAYR